MIPLSDEYKKLDDRLRGLSSSGPTAEEKEKEERVPNFKVINSPIPKDVVLWKGQTTQKNSSYPADLTPTTVVKTMPDSFLNGAQYLYDPEDPERLIKSWRGGTPEETAAFRGAGISSMSIEVDHKMPLWAGGTDSEQNKQNLIIPEHEKKTKVDAIVRTLYYEGKINLTRARTMMANWQNYDTNLVPTLVNYGSEEGELSNDKNEALSIAEKTKLAWESGAPKKVTAGDVWHEASTHSLAAKGVKSALSGLTAGWYQPEDMEAEKGEEVETAIAEGAGNLVGNLALFAIASTVLSPIAGAVGLTALAASWMRGSSLLRTSKIALGGKTIATISGATKQTAVKNAATFAGIGQLSREAFDGNRTERFLSDVAMGGITSIPGKTLKTYAAVGASTFTLDKLEGASNGEALLNSAIMVGFHKVGEKGRDRAKDGRDTMAALDYRIRNYNAAKPFGTVVKGESGEVVSQADLLAQYKPGTKKWTAEEVGLENEKMFEDVAAIVKARNVDPNKTKITAQEIEDEVERIIISGRQLYKEGLSPEKRELEDILDLKTMYRRENTKLQHPNEDIDPQIEAEIAARPEAILSMFKKNMNPQQVSFVKVNKGNLPTGEMNTVPLGVKGGGAELRKLIESGDIKQGDVLVFAKIKQDEAYLKQLYKALSIPEQGGDPGNVIGFYVLRNGKMTLVSKASSYSRNAVRPNNWESSLGEVDVKLHNDAIGAAMEKTGVSYGVAEVTYATAVGKKSKMPSLGVRFVEESYTAPLASGKIKSVGKLSELGKEKHSLVFGPNSAYVQLAKKALKEAMAIDNTKISGKGRSAVRTKEGKRAYDFVNAIPPTKMIEAIKSKDVEKVKLEVDKDLGLQINTPTAKWLIKKGKDVTIGDLRLLAERAGKMEDNALRQKAIYNRAPDPVAAQATAKSLVKKLFSKKGKLMETVAEAKEAFEEGAATTRKEAAKKAAMTKKAKKTAKEAEKEKALTYQERLQQARDIVKNPVKAIEYVSVKEGEKAAVKNKTIDLGEEKRLEKKFEEKRLDRLIRESEAANNPKMEDIASSKNKTVNLREKKASAERVKISEVIVGGKERAVDLKGKETSAEERKALEILAERAKVLKEKKESPAKKLKTAIAKVTGPIKESKAEKKAAVKDKLSKKKGVEEVKIKEEAENKEIVSEIEPIIEKKARTPRDANENDHVKFIRGLNAAIKEAARAKILRLQQGKRYKGRQAEIDKIDKASRTFTRSAMTKKAKEIYTKNEGNLDAGFKEYSEWFATNMKNLGGRDFYVVEKGKNIAFHSYQKMVESRPDMKFSLDAKGKMQTTFDTPKEASPLIKTLEENYPMDKEPQVATLNIKDNELPLVSKTVLGENGKWRKRKKGDPMEYLTEKEVSEREPYLEKPGDSKYRKLTYQEEIDYMESKIDAPDSEFFYLGQSDKEAKTLIAIKKQDARVEKFDEELSLHPDFKDNKYMREGDGNVKEMLEKGFKSEYPAEASRMRVYKERIVLLVDEMGIPRNRSISEQAVSKRLKHFNDRSLGLNEKKGTEHRNIIMPAKTLKEAGLDLHDVRKEDVGRIESLAMFDGPSLVFGETIPNWKKGIRMSHNPNQIKLTMVQKESFTDPVTGRVGDESFVVKTNVFTGTKREKYLLEQEIKKAWPEFDGFKEGDILTFDANVKLGKETAREVAPGSGIYEKNIKTESIRVLYGNKEHSSAAWATSSNGLIRSGLGLNEAMAMKYDPTAKAFKALIADVMDPKGMKLKDILEKHEIARKLLEDIPADQLKMIQLGAGRNSIGKSLDNMFKNLYVNRIAKGGLFEDSAIFDARPDMGARQGGFLKAPRGKGNNRESGECEMSYNDWVKRGKPTEVIVKRYPVTGFTSMFPARVKVLKDPALDGTLSVNHLDSRARSEADYDGDKFALFTVGEGKGQLPKELLEALKKESGETGLLYAKELSKKTSVDWSTEGFMKNDENLRFGGEGISRTDLIKRVAESVADAKPTIKVRFSGMNKVVDLYIGNEKKPFSSRTIRNAKTSDSKEATYTVKYDTDAKQLIIDVTQMGVDNVKSVSLEEFMGGKEYDSKKILKQLIPEMKNSKKADDDVLNSLQRFFGEFQSIFKINKEKTGVKDLSETIENTNRFGDRIEAAGGNIGPIFSITKTFDGMKPLPDITRSKKQSALCDQSERKEVIERFKDDFEFRDPESYHPNEGKDDFWKKSTNKEQREIVHKILEKERALAEKYTDLAEEQRIFAKAHQGNKRAIDIREKETKRKQNKLKEDFVLEWERVEPKLNQYHRDGFAWYLATAHDANLSMTPKYANTKTITSRNGSKKYEGNIESNSYYVHRLENVINSTSNRVGEAFYAGKEKYDPDATETLKTQTKSVSVKKNKPKTLSDEDGLPAEDVVAPAFNDIMQQRLRIANAKKAIRSKP